MADFLPWFPLYFEEFERGTRGFSADERWAYIALLWHQWERGSVPNDVRRLAHIVGETPARFKRMWEGAISSKFRAVDGDPSLLVNGRQAAEREREEVKIAQARRAGQASAGAKANRRSTDVAENTTENSTGVGTDVEKNGPKKSTSVEHTSTRYSDLGEKNNARDAGADEHAAAQARAEKRGGEWRRDLAGRWSAATGVAGFSFPGLDELALHVEKAAKSAPAELRDPAALFDRAVAEFLDHRLTYDVNFQPQVRPGKVIEHWSAVWERIVGAKTAAAAPAIRLLERPTV